MNTSSPAVPRSSSRRRQSDRRAETRQKLIDATIRALVEAGFSGTTVDAIASRAGVTRGALNHHFESKGALLTAATGQLTDHFAARLTDAVARLSPEKDPFHGMIKMLWATIYSAPRFIALLEYLLGVRNQREIRSWTKGELARGHGIIHTLLSDAAVRLGFAGPMPFEIIDLALSGMRGMALEVAIRNDPAFVERQLRLLADAVRLLATGGRPA